MNRKALFIWIACGTLAGWLMVPARANKEPSKEKPTPVLTKAESKGLLFMREEEKLARDVYLTLYAEWGLRPFSNISAAEQRHMDAILGLLEKYGLEDPTLDMGEFSNPKLQKLFNDLVTKGLRSELDALMVSALIEETDIADLLRARKRTDKKDLLAVYESLLGGSERHLNAFVRNIEARSDKTYAAQKLSQKKVDTILGR